MLRGREQVDAEQRVHDGDAAQPDVGPHLYAHMYMMYMIYVHVYV